MLCTFGCLDVTTDCDDEAALDHSTVHTGCHRKDSVSAYIMCGFVHVEYMMAYNHTT